MGKCIDRRFLWWTWKRHSWRRVQFPDGRNLDFVTGVNDNKVFWRVSDFDDGPYWQYAVAICECGEIRLFNQNATITGNACRPFESKSAAMTYINHQIALQSRKEAVPHA